MTNIQKLINQYYKTDGSIKTHPAEKYTNTYSTKIKKERRRKHRHLILDSLLNETPFTLKKYQIENIRYWIDRFNDDFKNFNRNSSNETIILAFIIIQQKQTNPRLNINNLSICTKYNLTPNKLITIQNRLIFKLMQTTELRYTLAKHVNHEILQKEGQ